MLSKLKRLSDSSHLRLQSRNKLPCQQVIDQQGEDRVALPESLAAGQLQDLPLIEVADQLKVSRKEDLILDLLDYRHRDGDGRFRQVSDQIFDGPKKI